MENKRIAILTQTIYESGGVAKVVVDLANTLVKKGYSVDIIHREKQNMEPAYTVLQSVGQKYVNLNRRNYFNKVVVKIIRTISVKKNIFPYLYEKNFFNVNSLKEDASILNGYDVIIGAHGFFSLYLARISPFLKSKIKKIGWQHSEFDAYFSNESYYLYEKQMFEKIYIKRNIDYNIVLTKKDLDKYHEFLPNVKHKKIYNPNCFEKNNISKLNSKEILFVGRISKEVKGLDLLLDIVEKIPLNDWKLRIVGEGIDNEWLKNEVKKRGLTEEVIIHGNVQKNIEKIYEKSTIFVSTSRWEGFGLVITEAMASGLPIIAFENAGPKEILDDGKYGVLVPKYDTDLFAQELTNLIKNHDELLRYQKLSLKRSEDFKIDKIIKEWEAIVNEK